jgi:hypothetical protein
MRGGKECDDVSYSTLGDTRPMPNNNSGDEIRITVQVDYLRTHLQGLISRFSERRLIIKRRQDWTKLISIIIGAITTILIGVGATDTVLGLLYAISDDLEYARIGGKLIEQPLIDSFQKRIRAALRSQINTEDELRAAPLQQQGGAPKNESESSQSPA